jgi:hypothetical protein
MDLVERGLYLATLGEHLAVAAAGHGRLVLVGGEAGIGKTALIRQFVDEQRHEARVLWGACDGLFTPQPLRPLLDIADELDLDTDAPQHEIFSATLDALRPGPTIAVFEDVHWADGATVDLLRFLGRRLDQTATLLIATYRDDELGTQHPLRAVLGDVEAARRISLAPLSQDGVRTLVGDSPVDPEELHRRTGGNPFFVTEALAASGAGVPGHGSSLPESRHHGLRHHEAADPGVREAKAYLAARRLRVGLHGAAGHPAATRRGVRLLRGRMPLRRRNLRAGCGRGRLPADEPGERRQVRLLAPDLRHPPPLGLVPEPGWDLPRHQPARESFQRRLISILLKVSPGPRAWAPCFHVTR